MNTAGAFVYRLYGAGNVLLYVGVTADWERRRRQHAAVRPWFPEVTRTELEGFSDRAAALAHEAKAIGEESPRYNVNHRPRPPAPPPPADVAELIATRLTLAQAAKMLGMDRSAAYRAFPPENRMKVGTVWFVSRSEVEAYAAEQRRGWPIGRPRTEKPKEQP